MGIMNSSAPVDYSMRSSCYDGKAQAGWHAGGRRRQRRRQKGGHGQRIPVMYNKQPSWHWPNEKVGTTVNLNPVDSNHQLSRTLPNGDFMSSSKLIDRGMYLESVPVTGGARKKSSRKKVHNAHHKKIMMEKKKKES